MWRLFVDIYETLMLLGGGFVIISKQFWSLEGVQILSGLYVKLGYLLFSLPYVIMMIDSYKRIYRILYVFPFSFIYYPIYFIVSIISLAFGGYKYAKLKDHPNQRAW
jgi:hypothetical protein